MVTGRRGHWAGQWNIHESLLKVKQIAWMDKNSSSAFIWRQKTFPSWKWRMFFFLRLVSYSFRIIFDFHDWWEKGSISLPYYYSQSFCLLLLQDFPLKNPNEKSKLCLSFSIRNPPKFQGWSLAESVKLAKDSPWKQAKNPIKRIIFQAHLFSQIRCSFSGSSDSPPHLGETSSCKQT